MSDYNDYTDCSRVLYVGFTVPDEVMERICRVDRNMPMQTHKLAWSVVRGIEAHGATVDLLSAEPVSNYPSNPKIFLGFKQWDRGNGSWNVMLPFLNLVGFKHISRFFVAAFFIVCWLIRTRGERNKVILLHGVHSAYMYAALAIRLFFSIQIVTLVTDPPGVLLSGEGRLIKILKKLDVEIIRKALQCMDGQITLTTQLAKYYAPRVPAIVVEGILYDGDYAECKGVDATPQEGENGHNFVFLYAGGLTVEYGVELLLQSFLQIKEPSLRLWILGKGELEAKIKDACCEDARITFMGYCPPSEVKRLCSEATVLINPRPSNQSFIQFSFPSKIIAYMASGRPVISTRLPGIPEEYFQYLILLENETPEDLSALLMQLRQMPRKQLDEIGERSKRYVLENKNVSHQGYRILSFLTQVVADPC